MKKTLHLKWALRSALLVLLLSGVTNVFAHDFMVDGIYYNTITASTVEVTSRDGNEHSYSGDVVVPNTVIYNGCLYTVIRIGYKAFSSSTNMTSIEIPNSVTEIGNLAFLGCSGLNAIDIPNSVETIGVQAFYNCSGLTSIAIPESVKVVEGYAFGCCRNLSTIDFNAANCTQMGDSSPLGWREAFYECTSLTTLNIGDPVQSVPNQAFLNCRSLSEITIGINTQYIGEYSFANCTSLSTVYFNAVNCVVDIKVFDGCTNLSKLYYGEGVQYIDARNITGSSLRNLKTITIPYSVTSIRIKTSSGGGFYETGWYNNQPDGVLYLDGWCLGSKGNESIGDLVFKEGTRGICKGAFSSNQGIGSVVMPNTMQYIDDYAFQYCSLTGALDVPNSVLSIGNKTFLGCEKLVSVSFGNSLLSIGEEAFNECNGITGSISIPNSVVVVGEKAFSQCKKIVSVSIGSSVTEIGNKAFENCTKLNTIVTLNPNPPLLGNDVFKGISSVATLFVPCGSQMAYFSSWNIFNYNNIHEDCTPRPVLVDSNVTGGTITPSVSEASMGQEVTLTVSPNPLMEMVSVTAYNTNSPSQLIPISPVDGTAVPTYKFIMPMFGVTISATFEHSSVYLVNVSQDIVGGSVTASTSEALAGETVELEVNPDYGYNLLQLSVCNYNDPSQTVTVTNRTFVMPSFDVMVSATFKKTIFSISISPGITGGTVSTSVSEQRAGKPVTIEALPNYGYELRSLTVANVNDPAQTVDVITASSIGGVGFIMPSFDVMVSAEFVYTSVDESEINPISVYPNPTSGVVKIEAENLRHISVFNVLGQKVYEEQVDGDELEINLSGCEPGVYLIRIETASGVTTKQVVVTK